MARHRTNGGPEPYCRTAFAYSLVVLFDVLLVLTLVGIMRTYVELFCDHRLEYGDDDVMWEHRQRQEYLLIPTCTQLTFAPYLVRTKRTHRAVVMRMDGTFSFSLVFCFG